MAIKSKKVVKVIDPISQEYQSQDFKQIWFGLFGQEPQSLVGEKERLRKILQQHFDKVVDLHLQAFELNIAGMSQVANNIKVEIQNETNKTLNNFEEFLGYKKLPEKIRETLQSKATSEGKFLNVYGVGNYHSVPPSEVVEAIRLARPYFQYNMEIWAIEDKQYLKDPVVVGWKYNNNKQEFYFIASWGDDIKVSDLFEKNIRNN